MKILAIETSCDETSAAVYDVDKGLLSNVVASQIDIHKKTGGIVPEVASRAHVEQILPVIDEALVKANVSLKKIDRIAVTYAPGLIGSLLVGVNTAKTLSAILNKPLLPVNHLEGHIYANFIIQNQDLAGLKRIKQEANPENLKRILINRGSEFKFPAVILLVSGGHTSLILMKDHGKYKTLGETLDDAAGEAFDKVARVLGLPYPGGPNISIAAEEYRKLNQKSKIKNQNDKSKLKNIPYSIFNIHFPRSMLDSKDFNFSFSGLKTSVLYKWQDTVGADPCVRPNSGKHGGLPLQKLKQMYAYEFEEAVVDILATKTISAAKKYKAKTVSICGGVAANKRLREEIGLRIKSQLPTTNYQLPPLEFCGDNAAMIAACASYKVKSYKVIKSGNLDFEVLSNKQL